MWAWFSDAIQMRWPPMLLAGVSTMSVCSHSQFSNKGHPIDMAHGSMHSTRDNTTLHEYNEVRVIESIAHSVSLKIGRRWALYYMVIASTVVGT